eukprot:TRINITY_DN39102_c0_g1_i2.p1 TRINITY_DN39102_c0_g1~~TRINITY_DN39102_c0_g1_i2.p1  ORF type:complete len:646 (-),score=138.81 TRINITY_DN39102_c0_g1_i2:18-1955(-)
MSFARLPNESDDVDLEEKYPSGLPTSTFTPQPTVTTIGGGLPQITAAPAAVAPQSRRSSVVAWDNVQTRSKYLHWLCLFTSLGYFVSSVVVSNRTARLVDTSVYDKLATATCLTQAWEQSLSLIVASRKFSDRTHEWVLYCGMSSDPNANLTFNPGTDESCPDLNRQTQELPTGAECDLLFAGDADSCLLFGAEFIDFKFAHMFPVIVFIFALLKYVTQRWTFFDEKEDEFRTMHTEINDYQQNPEKMMATVISTGSLILGSVIQSFFYPMTQELPTGAECDLLFAGDADSCLLFGAEFIDFKFAHMFPVIVFIFALLKYVTQRWTFFDEKEDEFRTMHTEINDYQQNPEKMMATVISTGSLILGSVIQSFFYPFDVAITLNSCLAIQAVIPLKKNYWKYAIAGGVFQLFLMMVKICLQWLGWRRDFVRHHEARREVANGQEMLRVGAGRTSTAAAASGFQESLQIVSWLRATLLKVWNLFLRAVMLSHILFNLGNYWKYAIAGGVFQLFLMMVKICLQWLGWRRDFVRHHEARREVANGQEMLRVGAGRTSTAAAASGFQESLQIVSWLRATLLKVWNLFLRAVMLSHILFNLGLTAFGVVLIFADLSSTYQTTIVLFIHFIWLIDVCLIVQLLCLPVREYIGF